MREPLEGASGIPPGGWIMRGMLVGKPVVAAVVVDPSEANVLLGSSASVGVGGREVMVGAKMRLVGTSSAVASLVPIGAIVY
jgi:hypothetical protein